MNQIYKRDVVIHRELPPETFDFDTVSIDLEMWEQDTNRLHRPHGIFASLACTDDGTNVYIIFDADEIADFLARIYKSLWVFHNASYDIKQLRRFTSIPDRKNIWDTMLVDLIRFSGYYDRFALDDLFRRYCGMYLPKDERKSFSAKLEGMTEEQIFYAACDVVATWRIYQEQSKQVDENDLYVWENIERPMLWTLLDTGGITIDKEKWLSLASGKEEIATELYDAISEQYKVKVTSTVQLSNLLIELGIPLTEKTKTGRYSVNVSALRKFKGKHPIIDLILGYRKPAKGASTYGKKWAEEWIEEDGRVYTSYRQIGTVTGRLASANPNLQNIPIRDDPQYRECFVAGEE